MITLPPIIRALDVEMIRDGGSFAARFEDENGSRYILLTEVSICDRGDLRRERVGYEPPILIDCDPAKRPPDTDQNVYGELSGPRSYLSWEQARTLMALTNSLAPEHEWRRDWLACMNYVVSNDGEVPPAMKGIMRLQRGPAVSK